MSFERENRFLRFSRKGTDRVNHIFMEQVPSVPDSQEPLGTVLSVRGSEARVGLPASRPGLGKRATVGAFVRIWADDNRLIGMITEVESKEDSGVSSASLGGVAKVDLMGEITRGGSGDERFQRGVTHYPAIGDPVGVLDAEELRLIYSGAADGGMPIGTLHHDETIPARVSLDNMLTKHFAILGSTGVGKSSGVAVILNAILESRPNLRVFLLDGHNEFARSFGSRANVVNAQNLKLPFWLFNFEEFVDVIYGGRPGVDEELDILAEHIPIAKGMYLMHRVAQDRSGLRRVDPRRAGYTVDTPVPYMLQDLISLIDERMGKLENRAARMHYHRLLGRIDAIKTDARYGFMFENANVGGDTMGDILSQLFRLEPNGQPMTVMQVAGLPAEVVDAVVCVVCRLAFDFGLWSDGAMPMLFVCEEAHRFAPADKTVGFAPTRRALLRIAKEGRKYGVYLGLVTQRPAELDPTIISQCNTLFAMRMANDRDQALLRSAVTDAVANLLAFVPSLGTREVVAFGEGVPLPARLTFSQLPEDRIPRSETFDRGDVDADHGNAFVKLVVDRWRGAAGGPRPGSDEAAAASENQAPPHVAAPRPGFPGFASPERSPGSYAIDEAPPSAFTPAPRMAPPGYGSAAQQAQVAASVRRGETELDPRQAAGSVASRIDQIRAQILKRGVGQS